MHYKIIDPDPQNYIAREYPSRQGGTFHYWEHKDHFQGAGANRVGLPHNVSTTDGFFMPQFEDYATATLFDGCLHSLPWSLGLEHRAKKTWRLYSASGTCNRSSTATSPDVTVTGAISS